MSRVGFEIDASGEIRAIAARYDLMLEPNVIGLEASAKRAGTSLPDNPRLLLLNKGQTPHTPSRTILTPDRSYLPTYRDENDILVYLERDEFSELTLTASIMRALVDRKRQIQNRRGKRVGMALATAGVVTSSVGEIIADNRTLSHLGYASFAGGVGLLAYYSNRGPAPLPDMHGLDAPIRVVNSK